MFGSAQQWLSDRWRKALQFGALHQTKVLVVDEVHTVAASPTFSLTDILIRGRQTDSQVIVSGVPFPPRQKVKERLIAGY